MITYRGREMTEGELEHRLRYNWKSKEAREMAATGFLHLATKSYEVAGTFLVLAEEAEFLLEGATK